VPSDLLNEDPYFVKEKVASPRQLVFGEKAFVLFKYWLLCFMDSREAETTA